MISSDSAPRRFIRRLVATGAIAWCVLASCASAQTATAPELKAAFLYNFAKFAEWPANALAPGSPLAVCIVNDRAVAEALIELTKGRSIDGHMVAVSTVKSDSAELATCLLLFASGLDAARSGALIESVAGRPVLTVGDRDKFAQLGGIANFFVENGTMRFAINLDAAQRAGVHLSSKVLSLARLVKDDRSVRVP